MALFTDPGVVTLDDLLQFESSLADTCSSYGIDIEAKIKIATGGIGDRLMFWMLGASQPGLQTFISAAPSFTRAPYSLKNVVVIPALYRWLCFEALSRVYAEAYNVQLNTRYQGKLTEYQNESKEARRLVFGSGLGIVVQPLSKPSLPIVSVGVGAITIPALFLQTSWVDENGRESAASAVTGAVLNGFSSVTVNVTDDLSTVPTGVIGWNIFASENQQNLAKQNVLPIAVAADWQCPASGLTGSIQASGGQTADFYVALAGRIQRG